MTLRIYNTLTRTKEVFTPIDPTNVRMYVCGPTVYDFAHIGNARPAIVFDVLYRLLRHLYGEQHVTYVRNITDVDDKINARALRDYPGMELNAAIRAVTEKTYDQYQKDIAALGCLPLPVECQPRATEHIQGMVDMIQVLLDRECAYIASGKEGREVLFSVPSMQGEYGKLSGRKMEEQLAGARVAVEAHKRNPADFVLWKESGTKEPGWDHEFTPIASEGFEAEFTISEANRKIAGLNSRKVTIHGRPGWHIECSVMSNSELWERQVKENKLSEEGLKKPHLFDIHGGGLDLIFPHHENEIAQSRCAHGTDVMANYWMHNGFLQVEGQKMSKSLGNFVTISDLLETERFGGKWWSGSSVRIAMLSTNYKQPIDWTFKKLDESDLTYWDWRLRLSQAQKKSPQVLDNVTEGDLTEEFLDALKDDLNIHLAVSHLHRYANMVGENNDVAASRSLLAGARLLGVEISPIPEPEGGVNYYDAGKKLHIEELVAERTEARREAKVTDDWSRVNSIKHELEELGVSIKDNKDGTTTWEVKR